MDPYVGLGVCCERQGGSSLLMTGAVQGSISVSNKVHHFGAYFRDNMGDAHQWQLIHWTWTKGNKGQVVTCAGCTWARGRYVGNLLTMVKGGDAWHAHDAVGSKHKRV